MISCLGLTSQSSSTTPRNRLFQAKNETECPSQDLAFVVRGQVCGVRIVSSTGPALVILNRIRKLHLVQFLQMRIQHFSLAL